MATSEDRIWLQGHAPNAFLWQTFGTTPYVVPSFEPMSSRLVTRTAALEVHAILKDMPRFQGWKFRLLMIEEL